MSWAIDVEDLSKTFVVRERAAGFIGALRGLFAGPTRAVPAVSGVSFRVRPGERVAFIGPNGAGKSTTIKMLTGILQPTAGRVRVLGTVPWQERRRLGYRVGAVFGQRSQLWYHLPAADTFELLAHVYDMDRRDYKQSLDELTAAFQLEPLLGRPVRQLSLGERMRCEIAASLLHRPEIVFLDEPTIGLDVVAKSAIRDLIRNRSEQHGSTILFTSHDTGDMERVCDRVMVVHEGRLLLDQQVEALRTTFIRRKLVTFITAEEYIRLDLPGITVVERSPHRLVCQVDLTILSVEAVIQAAMRASSLKDITVADPPMDEIIKTIYARAGAASAKEAA